MNLVFWTCNLRINNAKITYLIGPREVNASRKCKVKKLKASKTQVLNNEMLQITTNSKTCIRNYRNEFTLYVTTYLGIYPEVLI